MFLHQPRHLILMSMQFFSMIPIVRKRSVYFGWAQLRKICDDLIDTSAFAFVPPIDVPYSNTGTINAWLTIAGIAGADDVLLATIGKLSCCRAS